MIVESLDHLNKISEIILKKLDKKDCLFLIGDLIFANYQKAAIETIIVLLSYLILRFQMKRTRIFDI